MNTEFNNICNNALVAPGSPAQGDLYFFNGTIWTRFPAGVIGKFLRTQGALADPKWDNFISADFSSVLHSWLQGLSADDHPQYLNLNKVGQTLSRDLAVVVSKTVDGRDISVDGATLDALVILVDSLAPKTSLEWVKVSEQNPSGVGYVEFTGLTSSKRYLVVFEGSLSNNGEIICVRINNDTGVVYDWATWEILSNGVSSQYIGVATTTIQLTGQGQKNTFGYMGQLEITPDRLHSNYQFLSGNYTAIESVTSKLWRVMNSGFRAGTSILSSLRIYVATGTLTGRFVLYQWV